MGREERECVTEAGQGFEGEVEEGLGREMSLLQVMDDAPQRVSGLIVGGAVALSGDVERCGHVGLGRTSLDFSSDGR